MNKRSKPIGKKKAQVKKAGAGQRDKTKLETPGRVDSEALGGNRPQQWVGCLDTGDLESYLRLRHVLDSFHAVAIYYYARGERGKDRTERQEKVKQHLDSFLREAAAGEADEPDCPPGTRQCPSGDCIPIYQVCLE
jgi:hypothetical protein